MLNRLSSVLQSAADALAPPPPPLEDLKYHWKMVMRFYAQRTVQSKSPVEETNIPAHLEQLLRILISEDASSKNTTTECPCTTAGPCLEFLLQHHLMDLLVSLARADSPPGMRRYLLGYLRRFVAGISPHLLTMASIHLPLLRIITLCSQSKASPTEAEEIEFLLALCQIVHRHPYLSIIFNKETKVDKQSSASSSLSSSNLVQNDLTSSLTSAVQEPSQIVTDPSRNNLSEKTQICSAGQNGSAVKDMQETHSSGVEIPQCTKNKMVLGAVDSNQMDKGWNGNGSKDSCNGQEIGSVISDQTKSLTNSTIVRGNETSNNKSNTPLKLDSVKCYDVLEKEKELSHPNEEQFCGKSQTTSGSCTPEPFPCEDCPDPEGAEGRLPLLDAVLGYINSADSVTKLHVCEALLMLISIADETLSNAIARTSNLGLSMAEKLISSFQEIPPDIEPDHFEDIPQNWGPKTSQIWLEQHGFPGSRLIASFVSWLNFCDQLTVEGPFEISESVAGAVRALFFEIELESELRTGDLMRQQLITNIICLCLRHITSNVLLAELNVWLMGELCKDTDQNEDTSLKQLLLNNCLHTDNCLSLNSLRLFELLLENCDEHVLNCLVLQYLKNRAYCHASSRQNKYAMDSWSDEEDAREEVKSNLCTDSSAVISRTFAPHNIHKIIDSFLQLLPNSLRSATDYHESGYHQYIAEAQRQYSLNLQVCNPMGWETEALFPLKDSNPADTSPSTQNFNEGPFLHMIFTRLRGLPKQPYEMNLQLTALVSRLAMLPHPHLHEFLLNPLLPMLPGTATLYTTLQDVARELQAALASLPHSKKMLIKTRQELLGDNSHQHEFSEDNGCLYESVVVLEEFCKELAAIAYVKYHHSS